VSGPAQPAFDPFATIVHLRPEGRAVRLAWTPDVFRTLAAEAGDRVVGAKHADAPADFHADEWEMHPGGDEVLYLLAGALDVILDEPAGERIFGLEGGQACLVPRGVWHRLVLRRSSDLLFITPARGTRHRAVGTARPSSPDG
jgi:mannose-6-phosphate isomerase-like protein (cupin superfamily)